MKSFIVEFKTDATLTEVEAAFQLVNPVDLRLTMGPVGSIPVVRQVVESTSLSSRQTGPTSGSSRPEKTRISEKKVPALKGAVSYPNRQGLPTLKAVLGRAATLQSNIPKAMAASFPEYIYHEGAICVKRKGSYGNSYYAIDIEKSLELAGITLEQLLNTSWKAGTVEHRLISSYRRAQTRENPETSAASQE